MPGATLFHEAEAVTCDDLAEIPRRIGRSSLLWIDLGRDERELELTAELLDIEDTTLQRLTDGEVKTPALDDRASYTHITAWVPREAKESATLERIDCIVGERWVVTVHDRPIAVLDDFRDRTTGSGTTGRLDGPSFLAGLLEWALGEYARAFETVEAELEELDVHVLEGEVEDTEEALRRLVSLRRDIGSLHRSLTAHREPFVALTHPELDALSSEDSARRFGVLVERFDVTVQAGRDARASVVASFDVLMARTEHRTNEILKVLTLASVLFLPGSLIAGILGMNFRVSLFDHPGLFWLVVALVLAIVVGTTTVARRRSWI